MELHDPDQRTSVGSYLFARLRQLGIHHVFGVPGDYSLGLLDELEAGRSVAWIGMASELGAGYAADGYARANGFGALCTTFGVGELSAAVAVAGATAEDVAVLHIVGAPDTLATQQGRAVHHTFADGDHRRFRRASAETTRSQFVVRPESARDDIDAALTRLLEDRCSTYVLLPQDVVGRSVSAAQLSTRLGPAPFDADMLNRARELIRRFFSANRDPVIVVGHLPRRWAVEDDVRRLARRGARTASMPNSRGTANESSAEFVGTYNGKLSLGNTKAVVESVDGRVLLGCRLADTTTGGLSHVFTDASTLMVDHRRIAWNGEVVDGIPFDIATDLIEDEWPAAAQVERERANIPPEPTPFGVDGGRLSQHELWATIEQTIPSGMRLVVDTGTAQWGALGITIPDDTVVEVQPIWSAIGFALPAAIGAAVAAPQRRVMAVVGDGAAQMTMQELGRIGSLAVDPIVVLVDNHGYGIERAIGAADALHHEISQWDWRAVPAALGVGEDALRAVAVDSAGALRTALSSALAERGVAHLIVAEVGACDYPPLLETMATFLQARKKAVTDAARC